MNYISQCCNAQAKKPPLVRPKGTKIVNYVPVYEGDEPVGLGHWHCSSCGKSCKVRPVNVSKNSVSTNPVVSNDSAEAPSAPNNAA